MEKLQRVNRPSERVKEYLLSEFARTDLQEGARLPTNRELAHHLQVSVSTVQAALKGLSQEGRIRARVGSGTFLVTPHSQKTEPIKIAINVPLLDIEQGDQWLSGIGAGIFRAIVKARIPFTLVGIPLDHAKPDDIPDQLRKERAEVSGLITFHYTLSAEAHQRIIAEYERDGKPVVTVNPVSASATANFVSTDHFGCSRRMGEAWRDTGRRRVLMLSNGELGNYVTFHLRHAGLASGIGAALGRTVSLQTLENIDQSEAGGYQAMRELLPSSAVIPDAIYCNSDLQALGVLRALRECNLSVPAQASVVGGTGMDLAGSSWPGLTRLGQPFQQIGEQLVAMLTRRIEIKGAALPGVIVPSTFLGGETTRPEENALLGIARPPAYAPNGSQENQRQSR